MAYHVPEQDISDYYRLGYIVFRRLLPASLIRDLRIQADKARELAREIGGPNTMRLQPMEKYADALDLKSFEDFVELPALREALDQVLSADHFVGGMSSMGILFEPRDVPWSSAWHRDMTLQSSRLSEQDFKDLLADWDSVNQVNCPLYDDSCTWFVPGSNSRANDMPGEKAILEHPDHAKVRLRDDSIDPIEKELLCQRYVEAMPGSVQLHLHAGDFAMYRPIGWHIGNYVPYKKRATLHDGIFTERYLKWWRGWRAGETNPWRANTAHPAR